MSRLLRSLLLVAVLAGAGGLAVVLLRSDDPSYLVRETLHRSRYRRYDALIKVIAKKHGVDPLLVKAVIWRESAFQSHMVGTSGERGLMQVTEGAAQDWAKAEKIETFVPTDLFDPKTNVEVGIWYLKRGLDQWKSKDDPVPFALAEYNAGRGRVDRWVDESNMGQKATADDLRDNISFPGTKKYVEAIMRRRDFYQRRGGM